MNDVIFYSSVGEDPLPLIVPKTPLHPDTVLRSVHVKMGDLPVKSEPQTVYCSNSKLTGLLMSQPKPS